jgi:hypothetical protein
VLGPQRIIRPGGKELRALTGTGGIPASRNLVARDFLDSTDGEWLFMVDTDMGFRADTVERLIASADPAERPVIGALTFQLKRQRGSVTELRAERFKIQPVTLEYLELETGEVGFRPMEYARDDVVRVAGTGAACLLMHRDALAKVRARYGDCWFDPMKHPTGDRGKPRQFSEDLSFCVRLAAVDIPVYVDTSVKTTHEKGGIFLDEETYDLQRALRPTAIDRDAGTVYQAQSTTVA